jgi:hypothetical protein
VLVFEVVFIFFSYGRLILSMGSHLVSGNIPFLDIFPVFQQSLYAMSLSLFQWRFKRMVNCPNQVVAVKFLEHLILKLNTKQSFAKISFKGLNYQ